MLNEGQIDAWETVLSRKQHWKSDLGDRMMAVMLKGGTSAVRLDYRQVERWVQRIYQAYGFTDSECRTIAEALVTTDLYGIESHGVQRLAMYDRKIRAGEIVVGAHSEVVLETPVSAVVDGRWAMGQLVASQAMRLAIDKAGKMGVGIVTVRRSNHFGMAGYYARMASRAGMLGISATNTNPLMVPTHAMRVFLGSNPLALAMPAHPHDFLFDAATTTVSLGKIEVCEKHERPLPGQWAVDEQDKVCLDAGRVLKNLSTRPRRGGLLPIGGKGERGGGYKGYGLGLIVEILTAILSGGNLSADMEGEAKGVGHFFMALDLHCFGDAEAMIGRLSAMLELIRNLPAEPGETIYVHGDKEAAAYADRLERGIVINAKTWREMQAIADSLGVSTPDLIG